MVRRHGWQLPAHSLQVVAITVFFLLVVAFYAFFAPFLGRPIFEYAAIGIYTPVALIVFILYVRCTRINPADPGIMDKFGAVNIPKTRVTNLSGNLAAAEAANHLSPASTCRGSAGGHSCSKDTTVIDRIEGPLESGPERSHCLCYVGAFFYMLFVKEDCRKVEDCNPQQTPGQDALFCTLCNAEVRKFSKHCRSCDKCVDGFDHHCRWLNNCVGKNNYVSFIALMATSLLWLAIESGVGIAVLVLCFVNKSGTERNIVEKLGNGFSRAPFATVVAVCTAVSLLACVPLGELFFFHIILIRKGITTYEFVVAMRAMSEAPADEEGQNAPNALYSPTGSATTGFSIASSRGLQYKGAWCTPPRVFIDHQDEVIPHLDPGRVPSTVDPDIERGPGRGPRKQVKLSAWKLAKLDSNEALRAAARARASSSVLRPVDHGDQSSDGDASRRTSLSKPDLHLSPLRSPYMPSHVSGVDYESGAHSMSSFSSPGQTSPPIQVAPLPRLPGATHLINPVFQPAASYSRRSSVVWDPDAGRYVSVTASAPSSASDGGWARPPPAVPEARQPERVFQTGQSIFFGGPLLGGGSQLASSANSFPLFVPGGYNDERRRDQR